MLLNRRESSQTLPLLFDGKKSIIFVLLFLRFMAALSRRGPVDMFACQVKYLKYMRTHINTHFEKKKIKTMKSKNKNHT